MADGERDRNRRALGDLNARHIVPPMVHAGPVEHADLYVGVDSGCPFVDVTIRISGSARADCKRFVASTMKVLDRTHPDVVVIGSSTNRYVNESKYTLQAGGSTAIASSRARSSSPGVRACTRSCSSSRRRASARSSSTRCRSTRDGTCAAAPPATS